MSFSIGLWNGAQEVSYPEYKRQPLPEFKAHVTRDQIGIVNTTEIKFPATKAGFFATKALVLNGRKIMSHLDMREPLFAKKGERTTPCFRPGDFTILMTGPTVERPADQPT